MRTRHRDAAHLGPPGGRDAAQPAAGLCCGQAPSGQTGRREAPTRDHFSGASAKAGIPCQGARGGLVGLSRCPTGLAPVSTGDLWHSLLPPSLSAGMGLSPLLPSGTAGCQGRSTRLSPAPGQLGRDRGPAAGGRAGAGWPPQRQRRFKGSHNIATAKACKRKP